MKTFLDFDATPVEAPGVIGINTELAVQVSKQIVPLQDAAVRQQLIDAGWTRPAVRDKSPPGIALESGEFIPAEELVAKAPAHRHYAVTGRICWDDEDTLLLLQAGDLDQAATRFREELRALRRAADDTEIFVNTVVWSTAPINEQLETCDGARKHRPGTGATDMTDRTHPDSGRTTGGIVEMLRDRIAELEAQLSSSGFTAGDMATAAAQGFRDGVASVAASAGSELVAYAVFADNGNIRLWSKALVPHPDAKPLYLHPSPPEGAGWMPIETAPKDGTRILLHPAVEVHDAWSKGHWSEQQECWLVGGSASGVAHTYWFPLPPSPSSADEGGSND